MTTEADQLAKRLRDSCCCSPASGCPYSELHTEAAAFIDASAARIAMLEAVANKPKTMGEWMEGDEENLFTPVAPQTETAAVEHVEDAALPTPPDHVAAGVEWTAEGLADIAAQRPNLDDDRIHEAMWGLIFEERRRVATLQSELAEANEWRQRHSDDAVSRGAQSQRNWERAKELEQQVADLTAQLAAAAAELKEERDDREKYAGVYAEMNVALGNKLAAAQQRAEEAEAERTWQRELPNAPGDWMWVRTFDCGCCPIASGFVDVWKSRDDELEKLADFRNGELCIAHNGPGYDGFGVTAWMKVSLPPQQDDPPLDVPATRRPPVTTSSGAGRERS